MDKMLFTSSLNVFNLLYLSSASQLNVGCFKAGLPILGPPVLCGHLATASAMAWMATLIASATALATASLMICSVAIFI